MPCASAVWNSRSLIPISATPTQLSSKTPPSSLRTPRSLRAPAHRAARVKSRPSGPSSSASTPGRFSIDPPGTVDGGDICEAEDHFFIGLSHRTNEEGARQLTAHLNAIGYSASTIDIRSMTTILHLKSGISYIGDNTLVVMEEMADNPRFNSEFARFNLLACLATRRATPPTASASTSAVLIAEGFPNLHGELIARGFSPLVLNMSEFQKMDGGLSCLSLRF